MTRVDDANDDDELVYESTYFDIALPHGWTRVAHNSGLFCFLHEPSGVVAWSQPYVVQVIDRNGRTTLDDMVQAHRPPIEIFAAGCGMRQPDLNRPVKLAQAESILRRLNHAAQAPTTHQQDQRPAAVPDARTHNEPSRPPQSADAPASRKRRLPDDDDDVTSSDIAPPPPAANYERVVVGDVTMDNPAGKTAMVFLTEYLAAAGRAGPQFVQSASTDPTLPFRCAVVLDGAEYSHGVAVTKALARQVASENALEALLPGYWAGLKKEGAVRDVVSNVPQPPATDWAKPISTATTMDDFETMSIDDPGVLQGCMELSFKTPAQLLMEFQTKHKGIAVNYTTVPVPGGSGGDRNKFRVTASAGPSAAEGVASNKKLAKQFAAQALLAQLNPRVATYIELIRVHENSVKSHADGAHRAKMQKFSGKYGAKHATTPATTSGSAAPSILPTPPSSILPTPPSTTPAGGPLLERSSARTSHGQGYSRGPSNPSGYNSASTTSNVADPRRDSYDSNHGYGGYSTMPQQDGHGGYYVPYHVQHQQQPSRHQPPSPLPAQPAGFGGYNAAGRFPAAAYDYNFAGPAPPRPMNRPLPHPQGWQQQQQQYPPRSPPRNGGQHPGYGQGPPQNYALPSNNVIQQLKSDLRNSLQH